MDTYYEDILKKVETLMKDAQFAEAYAILDEELLRLPSLRAVWMRLWKARGHWKR